MILFITPILVGVLTVTVSAGITANFCAGYGTRRWSNYFLGSIFIVLLAFQVAISTRPLLVWRSYLLSGLLSDISFITCAREAVLVISAHIPRRMCSQRER